MIEKKAQTMSDTLFRDVVRDRHSVRSFWHGPVPEDVLRGDVQLNVTTR